MRKEDNKFLDDCLKVLLLIEMFLIFLLFMTYSYNKETINNEDKITIQGYEVLRDGQMYSTIYLQEGDLIIKIIKEVNTNDI